jgi:ribosomal protein L15E
MWVKQRVGVVERRRRCDGDVVVAEPSPVPLDRRNHAGLIADGMVLADERDTAGPSQRDRHLLGRDGTHDRAYQRGRDRERRLIAYAMAGQRRGHVDVAGV